jgi:hypothetical protein
MYRLFYWESENQKVYYTGSKKQINFFGLYEKEAKLLNYEKAVELAREINLELEEV